MSDVLNSGDKYGSSTVGNGKTICIDYSSVNVAKPFHIGHLSTTVIGGALYKIFGFLGYNVVGINHLGDYGTQFGKLICAYKHWGDRNEVQKGGIHAINDLYVRFNAEATAEMEPRQGNISALSKAVIRKRASFSNGLNRLLSNTSKPFTKN